MQGGRLAFAVTHLLGKSLSCGVPFFKPINGRRMKTGFAPLPSGPQECTCASVLVLAFSPSFPSSPSFSLSPPRDND